MTQARTSSERHCDTVASGPACAGDRPRGGHLELEVVDTDALVDAVLDVQVDHRIGVAEWHEAVRAGAIRLAEAVTVAVAVAQAGNKPGLGVMLLEERLDR